MATTSRELEQLVAKIQRQLAPKAEVLHDVRLMGRHTGEKRQIDVLVREQIGQYEIRIIIDCKDYKHPVDVKGVEEFWGLLDDVGAQKGVLVCPRGFTSTAKTRAEKLQIDLYSPVDTDSHKWQARATIPALCDFRGALISFGLSGSEPVPFRMPMDFFAKNEIYGPNEARLGTPLAVAVRRWNNGDFPTEPGLHERVKIFGDIETRTDNGYEPPRNYRVKVDLYASLNVYQELYYGQLPVPRISGFKDELTDKVITNAFEVGLISFEEVEKDWTKIKKIEEAPLPPVLVISGLMAWAESG
jgi:hypothetical protein